MNALMAVLAYIVAGLYFVIAFSVVPRLAAAATGASGLLRVARWAASAFFAGCALTHIVIGTTSLLAAVRGSGPGSMEPMAVHGMVVSAGSASRLPTLAGHVVPHVAQIVGGLTFIAIAQRRLEWTVMSKDVAEGYRRREMQFRSAFERAPVGIALVSLGEADTGRILQANPALAALAGMSLGDPPRSYQQLVAHSGPDAAAADLDLLRAGQPIVNRERRLVHADDAGLWVSVSASMVGDGAGDPEPFAVVEVRDVTGRRRAELLQVTQHSVAEAVSEAVDVDTGLELTIRLLCEGLGWMGGEYWEVDTGGATISRRTAWWSPRIAGTPITRPGTITYRRGDGLAGAVWARGEQVWLPDVGREQYRFPRAADAVASGVASVFALPIRLGDRAAVLVINSAGHDQPDRELTTALEAICAHIGRFVERGRAEEFRRLVESAPDAVVISDLDGRIVLVNARTEQLFGYHRRELLGSPLRQLVPEDAVGRRRDGGLFPVEVTLRPVAEGDDTLIARSIRDLTARHQAEELRFQLAAIVDSSYDAIIGSTLDGTITSWNRAAEEIFGYAEAEMVGRAVAILLPPHELPSEPPDQLPDQTEDQALLDRLRRGERIEHHDAVRLRRDGRPVQVSISMSPIRDPQGRLVGASRVIRDITQRKRAEAALSAAKESAEAANQALESFSYSVAHDLKAPLRSINGFSRILAERYSEVLDDDGLRYLELVGSSGVRMADLIDSLLRLSRVAYGDLRPTSVDLSALAHDVLQRLRQDFPDRQVQTTVEPGLTALGDATLLAAVMDNLLGNAWKFTRDTPDARIGVRREDGAVCVADNGAGFDMAHADKLFGVFQRLHSDADFEGTGVGLATVQRIVTRHGGRIWAESAPGAGATFRFTLGADQGKSAHQAPGRLGEQFGGEQTLLDQREEGRPQRAAVPST